MTTGKIGTDRQLSQKEISPLGHLISYGIPYNYFLPLLLLVLIAPHQVCGLSDSTRSLQMAPKQQVVQIFPSQVYLSDVSHAYPGTLWRRLTSSVPRRAQALSNVSLTLEGGEFCLLTGVSSSGKSTLFRLVQGVESPSNGGLVQVVPHGPPHCFVARNGNLIQTNELTSSIGDVNPISSQCPWVALPRVLEEKPSVLSFRNSSPRQEIIRQFSNKNHNYDTGSSFFFLSSLVDTLIHAFGAEDWMNSVQELSQSQLYVCQLLETALTSMLANRSSTRTVHNEDTLAFPAPVLLLDEWLDKETSTVIRSTQASIERFVQATGSVVVCATHVHDRYCTENRRHVILQSGKVISDTQK